MTSHKMLCRFLLQFHTILSFSSLIMCCQLLPSDPNQLSDFEVKQHDHITMVCQFRTTDNTEQVIAWKHTTTLEKQFGFPVAYGASVFDSSLNLAVETRYTSSGEVQSSLTISKLFFELHKGLYWCELYGNQYCNMTGLPRLESGTASLIVNFHPGPRYPECFNKTDGDWTELRCCFEWAQPFPFVEWEYDGSENDYLDPVRNDYYCKVAKVSSSYKHPIRCILCSRDKFPDYNAHCWSKPVEEEMTEPQNLCTIPQPSQLTTPPPQLTTTLSSEELSLVIIPIFWHIPHGLQEIMLTVKNEVHLIKPQGEEWITLVCLQKQRDNEQISSTCSPDILNLGVEVGLSHGVLINQTHIDIMTATLACSIEIALHISDTKYVLSGISNLMVSENYNSYKELLTLRDGDQKLVPSSISSYCTRTNYGDNSEIMNVVGLVFAILFVVALIILVLYFAIIARFRPTDDNEMPTIRNKNNTGKC
ncbi:uncharacterized protein [Amphiura filiformis]|uniref:uncharacterized protein n=1 Tax=Amphiura filiformis TaxID=82378 RepID=UPI003B20C320